MAELRQEFSKTRADVRAELPKVLGNLGVNQEDELACLHAVVTWLVRELGKGSDSSVIAGILSDIEEVA